MINLTDRVNFSRLVREEIVSAIHCCEGVVDSSVVDEAVQAVMLATDPPRMFQLIQDNDCHWYVIPADRREAFDDWVRSQETGTPFETDLEPSRVNGPHDVVFYNWSTAYKEQS